MIAEKAKCDYCGSPMILLSEVVNTKREVIQRLFMCPCGGVVHYKNFHKIDEPEDNREWLQRSLHSEQ